MNKTPRLLVPVPMSAPVTPAVIDDAFIKSRIHTIRGVQVLLDSDLAHIYQVETRVFNQAVKRNENRFPPNFRFRLGMEEYKALISQTVTSKAAGEKRGGRQKAPYVFTEQGIAMLSGVLKSDVAVQTSIRLMEIFVAMRKALASIAPLLNRIDVVERRQIADQARNEERFDTIFKAMDGGDFPPQKIFYDGQLWDARAFVDKLVKSARKSLLLVDNFSRMPPRDSVAGGIRRFSASLGPSLLRERGRLFPSSRQLVVSSTGRGATRRGHSNPARAGGLPPRARPGFPFRRLPQGPRQEVLRLHEDGPRGNPGPEGSTLTPLAVPSCAAPRAARGVTGGGRRSPASPSSRAGHRDSGSFAQFGCNRIRRCVYSALFSTFCVFPGT